MFVIFGVILLAASAIFIENQNKLAATGFLMVFIAYFCLILQSYLTGAPVQTRGGILDRKKSPIKYAIVHIILGICGVIALIVTVTSALR